MPFGAIQQGFDNVIFHQQHTVTKNLEINEEKSPKLPFAHFKHWFNMSQYDCFTHYSKLKNVQPCELPVYEQVWLFLQGWLQWMVKELFPKNYYSR